VPRRFLGPEEKEKIRQAWVVGFYKFAVSQRLSVSRARAVKFSASEESCIIRGEKKRKKEEEKETKIKKTKQ
jgi:hypothetical protein